MLDGRIDWATLTKSAPIVKLPNQTFLKYHRFCFVFFVLDCCSTEFVLYEKAVCHKDTDVSAVAHASPQSPACTQGTICELGTTANGSLPVRREWRSSGIPSMCRCESPSSVHFMDNEVQVCVEWPFGGVRV